jgi:hypothetical protein
MPHDLVPVAHQVIWMYAQQRRFSHTPGDLAGLDASLLRTERREPDIRCTLILMGIEFDPAKRAAALAERGIYFEQRGDARRIISMRKANARETQVLIPALGGS